MIGWAKIDSFPDNFTDERLTVNRACPLCGAMEARTFVELRDFQFYTDSASEPKRINIKQKQCCRCLAMYMNPVYTPFGFQVLFRESGASYGAPQWKYENRVSWLLDSINFKKNDAVVDLGCHSGKLLAMLPEWLKKTGVEVSRNTVERARLNYPEITFICDDLVNFDCGEKVDVFTMFHVLEHLVDPVAVLSNLLGMADETTLLAIEVPVLECGTTRDINGFFSIHHLTHFTYGRLRRCLLASGWKEIAFYPGTVQQGCRILAVPGNEREWLDDDLTDDTLLYEYLGEYYANLAKLHKKLEPLKSAEKCVIWGGGTHLELLYQLTPLFRMNGYLQWHIVDVDQEKQGGSWRGITISSPEDLEGINWAKCFLLISSFGGQEAIAENALRLGVPASRMVRLYEA